MKEGKEGKEIKLFCFAAKSKHLQVAEQFRAIMMCVRENMRVEATLHLLHTQLHNYTAKHRKQVSLLYCQESSPED